MRGRSIHIETGTGNWADRYDDGFVHRASGYADVGLNFHRGEYRPANYREIYARPTGSRGRGHAENTRGHSYPCEYNRGVYTGADAECYGQDPV